MVTQGNWQVVQGQLFSLFTSSSFSNYFYLQIIERKKEHNALVGIAGNTKLGQTFSFGFS